MANSSAILTDAFPADERGLALGLNQVAAIAGSFIGLVLGGVLGPISWRYVFLVSVPFGVLGTVWSYLKLRELGVRRPASLDWWGNVTFAAGLIAVLVGITYGIQPYGGHTMGWTSPLVLTLIFGGLAVLALFCVIETRVAEPMFRLALFRIRPFTAGNVASLLAGPGPWRADVRPDHLAAGHLPAHPRLQLRADPAVGRDRDAAADRRLPGRRAGFRLAVRPVRRPALRHRRHGSSRGSRSGSSNCSRWTSPTGSSRSSCC